ncbi:MAG TPA: hypothetical protein VEJ41_06835 [Candidatus Acidoferrales bacterium]|nr:hypothetical protein [Candidatus Acidoferrales bacterium]
MNGLRLWHDFFMVVGPSAATLIGLVFVVATLGTTSLQRIDRSDMSYYITPTFVHFSAVLGISTVAVTPLGTSAIGVIAGCISLWGLIDTLVAARRGPASHNPTRNEPLWFSVLPLMGYILTLLASTLLVLAPPYAATVLMAGLVLLLAAGLRNAWSMTVFISTRENKP